MKVGNSRFTLFAEAKKDGFDDKVERVRNSDAKKTRSFLGDMGME